MSKEKVNKTLSGIYYAIPFEVLVWISGLIILACYHPLEDQHYSLCLLKGLGFEYCPGCGLGTAVSFIFHGEFSRSWQTHPLGFFALGILTHRIFQLIRNFIREKFLNKPYDGKCIEIIA